MTLQSRFSRLRVRNYSNCICCIIIVQYKYYYAKLTLKVVPGEWICADIRVFAVLQDPSMDDSSSNSMVSLSEFDNPPCYTNPPNYTSILTKSPGSPHRCTWKSVNLDSTELVEQVEGRSVLLHTAPESATSCTSAQRFWGRSLNHNLGFYSNVITVCWSVFIKLSFKWVILKGKQPVEKREGGVMQTSF